MESRISLRVTLAAMFVWFSMISSAAALVAQEFDASNSYIKSESLIPMRDGVKLYTEIYTPRDQSGDLPIVFLRTPYRVADPAGGFTRYFA